MKVRYSYLPQKFQGFLAEGHPCLEGLRDLLRSGDFTLGKAVKEFEKSFAELVGAKYAIGVANGTDALRIALRMAGVKPGDEVITAANTFVASAGCIDELFAVPKFVDMAAHYVMDANLLEKAITPKTKAIIPVHFAGEPVEMDMVMEVANKHGIAVIEDACQGVLAEYKGQMCGTIGLAGCFSLHPLKNLNCLGDGGVIVTNDEEVYKQIYKYRNHGLRDRDNVDFFGCNSRLDTLQAIFLNYLIKETKDTVGQRRANAKYYREQLLQIKGVAFPPERPHVNPCYHLFMFEVDEWHREGLLKFLNNNEIEAKVHYPVPLQGVLKLCGYTKDDFPQAFHQSDRIISIPTDEHISKEEQDFVILKVKEFMETNHS